MDIEESKSIRYEAPENLSPNLPRMFKRATIISKISWIEYFFSSGTSSPLPEYIQVPTVMQNCKRRKGGKANGMLTILTNQHTRHLSKEIIRLAVRSLA